MTENNHQLKGIDSQSVEIIHDLIYACPNGQPLLADLYLPKNRKESIPVIIWLHGGGWRFGSRKLGPDFSEYFTKRGYAMVSIEYRLSGEAIFPAPIYDVKTAVRWVKKIAKQYGLNPHKIGLWGSSAGGHLAALVAATGSHQLIEDNGQYEEMSSEVHAVAIGYGPVDFLKIDEQREVAGIVEDDPESLQLPEGKKSTDPDSFESLFLGAPIQMCADLVKEANPITYVQPGMPPFFIMHGLSDIAIPSQQSELLYQALAEKGNNVSLYLINGLGHGFLNRTNLDKAGPHLVNYRASLDSEEVAVGKSLILVFDTIEEFFRKNLK
ncbi:alpha/beta hydrolase [Priestia filamentosa]|uniref:alpha/beta hydrolase fold domain-containing protein n=1 Tax=Priestia filamentosa TaxID=1402861 RepID=UPI003857AB9A